MKNRAAFGLVLLIGIVPLFAQEYSMSNSQTFLFQGETEFRISIETYKEFQGWTPCHLFFGDLAIKLWMGPSGEVCELRNGREELVDPLFTIDLVSRMIIFSGAPSSAGREPAGLIPVAITESNRVRTRILIPSDGLAATLTLDEDRERAEFCLFDGRLRLPAMFLNTKPITPAQSEIQLYGPSVSTPCLIIRDRLADAVYFKRRPGGGEGRPQALGIRVK